MEMISRGHILSFESLFRAPGPFVLTAHLEHNGGQRKWQSLFQHKRHSTPSPECLTTGHWSQTSVTSNQSDGTNSNRILCSPEEWAKRDRTSSHLWC